MNTDYETNADQQGLLYYNKVLSDKNWIYLPQETPQNVGGIEVRAIKIRKIINQIVN